MHTLGSCLQFLSSKHPFQARWWLLCGSVWSYPLSPGSICTHIWHRQVSRGAQRHQPLHFTLWHGNATVPGGKSPDIQACKKSVSSRAPEALLTAETCTSCVSSQKPLIREYVLLLLLLLLLSGSLAQDCVSGKKQEESSSSFPTLQCSTALLNPRLLCL